MPVSKARTNKFYIYRQCTYIVYVQDVGILGFYFRYQKYFGTIPFCRMSEHVRKLRWRIAQVPLYIPGIFIISFDYLFDI